MKVPLLESRDTVNGSLLSPPDTPRMSLLPLYHDEECLEAEQRAALSMKGGTGELRQSSNHNQDWLQQIGTAGGHTPMDPWAYNFIPSSGACELYKPSESPRLLNNTRSLTT